MKLKFGSCVSLCGFNLDQPHIRSVQISSTILNPIGGMSEEVNESWKTQSPVKNLSLDGFH